MSTRSKQEALHDLGSEMYALLRKYYFGCAADVNDTDCRTCLEAVELFKQIDPTWEPS